jgi:hypothetical protein
MKQKHLLLASIIILSTIVSKAQILNNTLDNWALKTSSLAAVFPVIPGETHTYNDPIAWSSGNQATTNSVLGNGAYVTQDTIVKYEGYSSARLESNEITITGVGTFVIPGLLVNGDFVIDPLAFASGLDPFSVPGSGSKIVGAKPSKLTGYFKYNGMSGDTAEIVAALVTSTRTEVARARFTYSGTTPGFVYFEAPFNYTSCDPVDTMIIFASSSPFSSGPGSGFDGSVLWIDSLDFSTTPTVNVPPLVVNDNVTTTKNVPVTTTTLLSNDIDCEGTTLSLTSVSVSPLHGSATVAGNNVTYIPTLNYFGADQYTYIVSDGGGASATGIVDIVVNDNVGIDEVSNTQILTFPNPANTQYTFNVSNKQISSYKMMDIAGNTIMTGKATSGNNSIETSSFANGIYILTIYNNNSIVGTVKVNIQH